MLRCVQGRRCRRYQSSVAALSPVSRRELARDIGLETRQMVEDLLRLATTTEVELDARQLVPAVRTHRLQLRIPLERRNRCFGLVRRDERQRQTVKRAVVIRVGRESRLERSDRRRMVVQLLEQEPAVEQRLRILRVCARARDRPWQEHHACARAGYIEIRSTQAPACRPDRFPACAGKTRSLSRVAEKARTRRPPGCSTTVADAPSVRLQALSDRLAVSNAHGGDFDHDPDISDQQQRKRHHRQMAIGNESRRYPATGSYDGRCHQDEQLVDNIFFRRLAHHAGENGSGALPREREQRNGDDNLGEAEPEKRRLKIVH